MKDRYIGITQPLNIVSRAYANLDAKYGPYNSIENALENIPMSLRIQGLTIGIIIDNSIREYWWKNGIEDTNLILKSNSEVDLSDLFEGLENKVDKESGKFLMTQEERDFIESFNESFNIDILTVDSLIPPSETNVFSSLRVLEEISNLDIGSTVSIYDGLDSESITSALSANQGKELKTMIDNLTISGGGISKINIDGNGNAITSISLNGSEIDVFKDKTFLEAITFNSMFSIKDEKIEAKLPLYSLGNIVAYGIEDSAGSISPESIYNGLDSTSTTLALSANMGKHLKSLIDTIEVGGGTVDLTNYYTREEVNNLIDSVNAGDIDLTNYYTKEETNDNFAKLAEFTSFKTLFDSLFIKTSTNEIEAKLSLYSLGGVSAYGFSEEISSGGGIINILPDWDNYSPNKSGWALAAGLGISLYDNKADKTEFETLERIKADRTWVENLLEEYEPTDTTYTAGRGLTLTENEFSTSFDIDNYVKLTEIESLILIKKDNDGDYYSEKNFYSLGGISAYGKSVEEGEDGIINVIDTLTSTSKTDPLSANMGRYLKILIDNIEIGEGGQVLLDWEAITGKPDTFTPSLHTHAISDITNLQTELDDKALGSSLTTHINKTDNPHEVTKAQVGLEFVVNKDLSNVDNIQQATKEEFTSFKTLFDSMFELKDDKIQVNLGFYGVYGISAYGFSEEGGDGNTGGIINIIDNLTSMSKTDPLSANMGYYLKTLIDNIDVGDIDLSNYYTKAEVNTIINDIDVGDIDLSNYYTKPEINSLIDSVGESLIKKDEENDYYSDAPNFYSLGGISAYGKSVESDEGGIINVVDSLTSTNKTIPLSANQGRYLKLLIDSIDVEDIDLSNYYTKTEVNTLIDDVNTGDIDLTNYYIKTETYSRSEVDNLIDSIDVEDLIKEDSEDNYYSEKNFYSLSGISAFGKSVEGSEGDMFNILLDWTNYSSDKSGWVLGAGLGKDLYDNKADKTWVENLLEEYKPTDTDKYYREEVSIASNIWEINHNLDKYPSVTIVNNFKRKVIGDVEYIDKNNIKITFTVESSGEVFCN